MVSSSVVANPRRLDPSIPPHYAGGKGSQQLHPGTAPSLRVCSNSVERHNGPPIRYSCRMGDSCHTTESGHRESHPARDHGRSCPPANSPEIEIAGADTERAEPESKRARIIEGIHGMARLTAPTEIVVAGDLRRAGTP